MNILAVLVALAAVVSLIRMVNAVHISFSRDRFGSIAYSLQEGDYAEMVRYYYRNAYDVAPFSSAYDEEYHVAEYTDAAFRRQFYEAIGEAEMAGRFEERMEAARRGVGSLSVSLEDVDRLIERVPLKP